MLNLILEIIGWTWVIMVIIGLITWAVCIHKSEKVPDDKDIFDM